MDVQLYSILNSALDTGECWHFEWTCHLNFHYPSTILKIEVVVSPEPWYYQTEHHCTWEENTAEMLAELKYYSVALNMSDVSCYINCLHKNWDNLRFVFDFAKSAETLVIKKWSYLKYFACALSLPILCHTIHTKLALESVCFHCMHYQLEETCPGISSYVQLLTNFMHKLP